VVGYKIESECDDEQLLLEVAIWWYCHYWDFKRYEVEEAVFRVV